MIPDVHWTAYLSALCVPVVAAFGVLIAFGQWRTARDKLKLDLFDRRMALYQAATAELTRAWGGWEDMGTGGSCTDRLKLQEAKWLTSDDVAAYFDDIFQASLEELATFGDSVCHDPSSPEYDGDLHDAHLAELRGMYDKILATVNGLFSPFLSLKH